MTTTTVDDIDARSTYQRALDHPAITARKIDLLRTSRIDPETGKRVPWRRRYMHLTVEQQNAARAGGRAAARTWGADLPLEWQDSTGGHRLAANEAIEEMNQRYAEAVSAWRFGGAGALHVKAKKRVFQRIARSAKPKRIRGRDIIEVPFLVYNELTEGYLGGEVVEQPGARPIEPMDEEHVITRNIGGAVMRRVPRGVARQVRAGLEPYMDRWHKDPVGDAVAGSVSRVARIVFETGQLPDGSMLKDGRVDCWGGVFRNGDSFQAILADLEEQLAEYVDRRVEQRLKNIR